MPRTLTITLFATFAVIFAFASCSGKKEAADAAEAVREQPAPAATPYEAEVETVGTGTPEHVGATGAPGKALLESRCTVCHNLERVQKKKLDLAGWENLVKRMEKIGAKLDDVERDTLVKYLAATYGK